MLHYRTESCSQITLRIVCTRNSRKCLKIFNRKKLKASKESKKLLKSSPVVFSRYSPLRTHQKAIKIKVAATTNRLKVASIHFNLWQRPADPVMRSLIHSKTTKVCAKEAHANIIVLLTSSSQITPFLPPLALRFQQLPKH